VNETVSFVADASRGEAASAPREVPRAMGGKGKGGARAAFLPPARSRPPSGEDAGPTITEKIKKRKAEGGAEGWDAFKARVKHQQQEAAASENHEVLLSVQHREMLDREREARLARREPVAEDRKRKASDDSSDSSDSESSEGPRHRKEKKRKREHKSDKHKSDKHKSDKHKSDKHNLKHKHKKKHRHEHRHDVESAPRGKATEPVALSAFLAAQSDSDG
jgi:hypothetical protein